MSNPQITIKPRRVSLQVNRQETTVVQVGIPGPAGTPGESGNSYERTFTQADLSIAGVLAAVHDLGSYPSAIALWDGVGEEVMPDRLEIVSVNAIAIHLESFTPLAGTWTLSIGG